jgi:hypothetical protein
MGEMEGKLPTDSNDAKHTTSLSRLKHGQCRWIISERPQKLLFCAAPAERGSWCTQHARIVYQLPKDRSIR